MIKRIMFCAGLAVALVLASGVLRPQSVPTRAQVTSDPQVFDQEAKLAELRKQIAGKENLPAETVFKNIQFLKGVPAARLLAVMKIGYSRSLGVNMGKGRKSTKQTARDMAMMVRTINNDLLKNIKNLKSESPVINCTTCHRGQTKPALDLGEAAPKS